MLAILGTTADITGDPGEPAEPRVTMGPNGEPADSGRAPYDLKHRLGTKAQAIAWQTILNNMPPHDTYIEPFLGWATIIRTKRMAPLRNIGIDRNEERIREARVTNGTSAVPDVTSRGDRPFEFIHGDGIEFLERFDYTRAGRVLIYCDPPYPHETRAMDHQYLFEMSTLDHWKLLDVLLRLPAMVMVSSYYSKLYADILHNWRLVTFEAMTRGGYTKTEHLWCNFSEPIELHDYRFLGKNFRERQDIKRLKGRWVARLKAMPPLKRQALLAALQETKV